MYLLAEFIFCNVPGVRVIYSKTCIYLIYSIYISKFIFVPEAIISKIIMRDGGIS